MAKSSKNSHVVQGIEEDPLPKSATGADSSKASDAPERVALTTEQLNELFSKVEEYDQAIGVLQTQLDATKTGRSDAVRAIVEAVGNKGPWNIKGKRISVTERGGRFNMQRESDAKLTL